MLLKKNTFLNKNLFYEKKSWYLTYKIKNSVIETKPNLLTVINSIKWRNLSITNLYNVILTQTSKLIFSLKSPSVELAVLGRFAKMPAYKKTRMCFFIIINFVPKQFSRDSLRGFCVVRQNKGVGRSLPRKITISERKISTETHYYTYFTGQLEKSQKKKKKQSLKRNLYLPHNKRMKFK